MKTKLFLVFLLSLSLLSGCAPKKPKVCTTVYPVEYLVSRIGGDYVDTCNISENNMIQRTSIKENYMDELDNASALFYIGGLEPYMEMYLDDIRDSGAMMVDLSTTSGIYDFKRYSLSVLDGKEVVAESPYYDSDVFRTIDMYETDPFLWMDAIAMTSMGSTIRDFLKQEYPEYSKAFDENYNTLETDLARLDADYQTLKENGKTISFVSMSASFGSWQKSYGIRVYPISLSKYGALPNEVQLAEIKKRIVNDGVHYIVKEQNLPEDMQELYERLTSELGLTPVDIHNLSSLTENDQQENRNYLSLMYRNLEILESMEQ